MTTLAALTTRKRKAQKKKQGMYRTSALIIIWVAIMAFTFFQGNVVMGEIQEPRTVVVAEGDTLWMLAQTHSSGRDIRLYIEQIRTANELSGSILHPGQKLILP